MKKTCNQCKEEMILIDNLEIFEKKKKESKSIFRAYVCRNPKCPNYALLQIPLEEMTKN